MCYNNIYIDRIGDLMDYERLLKIISENVQHGIFVVDKDGLVVFYNKSVNNLAGLSSESMIDKHILDIFPRLTEQTSTIMRVLSTGQEIKNYVQSYYNYQSKYVTILTNTLPYYENGELKGAIEIYSEVNNNGEVKKEQNYKSYNIGSKSIGDTAYYTTDSIIGSSKKMGNIKEQIKKIANSRSPVLVYGETGTGKELVVQSIHNESNRSEYPFVAQNCASIPETLLESMLFGTTLGSFTGSKNTMGLIEAANGGTLFLDEINSMDITLQAKILRFLQEGYIRRIGENKSRKVDVRIIAALNEDPYEAIKSGNMRQDLFFRLNVINFTIPPLRENRDDIKELTYHFLQEYNKELGKDIVGFSDDVIGFFMGYSWPGNTRELKHIIEHAINMTDGDILTKEDLPDYLFNINTPYNNKNNREKEKPVINDNLNNMMKDYEEKILLKALKESDYNITQTANKLNIARQTLYYKMKEYDIKINRTIEN